MGEKDILEKVLMSYADVFADCENALAYGGRRRLEAEKMHPAPTESFYRGKEKLHNQFSDVSAYLVEDGEIRLQYIIGNETALEGRQVLRKASYQGGAYRAQLESGRPVYPVIGMVIDWSRKGTGIPRSLHELLRRDGASEEDLELVDDVKLAVYHMNNLPAKIRERFTSDMGFVVDYLNEGSFEHRKDQKIVHMEALCEMMEALTEDSRFTEAAEEMLEKQREGKEIAMCEYIDMLEARGEARGKARGEVEGERKLLALLAKLYALGRDEDAKLIVRDEDTRKRLYEEFCITHS